MSGRGPERVLIVDGYNVLNARRQIEGARALADARDALIHDLQDYAGFSEQRIIVVFDAWQADRDTRSVERYGAVEVVFTQKGEIADHYIERLCDSFEKDIEYRRAEVRVATSDALEQTIVLGRGATRISARELLDEMRRVRTGGTDRQVARPMRRFTVEDRLDPQLVRRMRELTRGK